MAEDRIFVSSRLRLMRNYGDIPFSPNLTEDWAGETVRRAEEALGVSPVCLQNLSERDRLYLMEQGKISPECVKGSYSALFYAEGCSVMANAEDHITIMARQNGLTLGTLMAAAKRADDRLAQHGAFAYDREFGYLTVRPERAGTGLLAEAILHLFISGMPKKHYEGIDIRPWGDGKAGFFIISNHDSIGMTEEEIVLLVEETARQAAMVEREAEETADKLLLEDRVMRAVGIMREARLLRMADFTNYMSALRMAGVMGLVDILPEEADRLWREMQPSSIRADSIKEADMLRAERMRRVIRDIYE